MSDSIALLTIKVGDRPHAVVEAKGKWWPLEKLVPALEHDDRPVSWHDVLQNWSINQSSIEDAIEEITASPSIAMEISNTPDKILAPIQYPNKALFMGFNYHDHLVKDAGIKDFKKEETAPFFFLKPPTTSLTGGGATVPYPEGTSQLDWEVELVVVIGKGGKKIAVEDAMDHVAGYAVGLDISARDWQFNPRHPKQFDIFCGKAFDKSSPFGPKVVLKDFVDVKDLELKLWVNGELKQDSHTREMIWSIPEQISLLSQYVSLEAGDVLFTGSPAGVGWATKTFLKKGDVIDAEITGLGRLNVTIT